ncbi:MAG TPA: hypothetical protein VFH54_12680 [Mycobacteriales bacterium]|nr:hypothetical protein [Mycobacteriales bacterium]
MAGCSCFYCTNRLPFGASQKTMCTGPETLVPGRLRGYRAWALDLAGVVDGRGLGLRPLRDVDVTWDVTLDAQCVKDTNTFQFLARVPWRDVPERIHGASPSPDCDCGIYGWYDPQDTRIARGHVYGVIDATGRVLLGQHGFRASQATVRALVAANPLLTSWWESKGIDVYPTLDDLVQAYPPDDVSELVPPPPPQPEIGEYLLRLDVSAREFQAAMQRIAVAYSNPVPTTSVRKPRRQSARRARPVPDEVARARAGRSSGPQSTERPPKSVDPRGAR